MILFHKRCEKQFADPNIRVACLTCLGAIVSIPQPLIEVWTVLQPGRQSRISSSSNTASFGEKKTMRTNSAQTPRCLNEGTVRSCQTKSKAAKNTTRLSNENQNKDLYRENDQMSHLSSGKKKKTNFLLCVQVTKSTQNQATRVAKAKGSTATD